MLAKDCFLLLASVEILMFIENSSHLNWYQLKLGEHFEKFGELQ